MCELGLGGWIGVGQITWEDPLSRGNYANKHKIYELWGGCIYLQRPSYSQGELNSEEWCMGHKVGVKTRSWRVWCVYHLKDEKDCLIFTSCSFFFFQSTEHIICLVSRARSHNCWAFLVVWLFSKHKWSAQNQNILTCVNFLCICYCSHILISDDFLETVSDSVAKIKFSDSWSMKLFPSVF